MALTESEEYKTEIIGPHQIIQLRINHIVLKDGVQFANQFERKLFAPGHLDSSRNYIKTDVSGEADVVKNIAGALWTDAVHAAYKTKLEAEPTPS